jgi:hypothetical protein
MVPGYKTKIAVKTISLFGWLLHIKNARANNLGMGEVGGGGGQL